MDWLHLEETVRTWVAFGAGCFCGAFAGIFVMALCQMASEHRRLRDEGRRAGAFRVPTDDELHQVRDFFQRADTILGEKSKGGA